MLASYFQYRADLVATSCRFQCPASCDAPGCWASEVIVEVTVFDLIKLGQVLNTPISSLFFDHCCLGFQTSELNQRYKRLLLKMIKPCHFLQKTLCAVHDSKPLNCVLFPEYHQAKDLLSEFSKHSIFSKFPCLTGDITISDKRRHALEKLRRISRIEEAVSCYFLLDTPSFIIDPKPFNKRLKKDLSTNNPITVQEYDRLFVNTLKKAGLFNSIKDKVFELDTPSGIENIVSKLDQDAFVRPLLQKVRRPEVIYKLKRNRISKHKRKLVPRALTFM